MEKKVTLKQLYHREQESIGIYFQNYSLLKMAVRKLPGVKWSQTNRCWYVPLDEIAYKQICNAFDKTVNIDNTALKQYLQKRKQVTATIPVPSRKIISKPVASSPAWKLSKENLAALEKYVQELKLRSYGDASIRTYRYQFLQLLQILKNKAVTELTPDDLRRYMVYAMEKEGITENTAHSRLNAIKFYFEKVLHKDKFFWEIPRPKKPKDIPTTFNQDEIAAIINSRKNKKHKVMLMLAYSSGLRVSEVVDLKTYEIDSKRMTILIRQAKGKKDRMASLSPVLLVMLREYARQYKPDKKGYLFEGRIKGTPYSIRSLEAVIQAAKNKAGVMKPGSIHTLRHSFATHLLDKGTDVTMIQKLLGHNDIKTTLRYLHTSNRDLLKIVSPLDDLTLT